jgi:hypothetical protein
MRAAAMMWKSSNGSMQTVTVCRSDVCNGAADAPEVARPETIASEEMVRRRRAKVAKVPPR